MNFGVAMTHLSDVFVLEVDDAIAAFRGALVALIPSAERVGLVWRPEHTHDDWERLAESVFEVMVSNPVRQDIGSGPVPYPLARYDFDLDTYEKLSWLEADLDADDEHALVLVRFLTVDQPFDTPLWAHVRISDGKPVSQESSGLVPPKAGTRYRLRRRFSGSSTIVRSLNLEE